MTKKSYATNVSMILGVSLALMLFLFLLVAHHRDIADRVQQHRGALGTGSNAADRTKPVGHVSVPSAHTQGESAKKAGPTPPPSHDGK
jgi:hypothetical protein